MRPNIYGPVCISKVIISENSLYHVCQKRSGGSGKHCGWAPWCNLEGSLFCNDAREHRSIKSSWRMLPPLTHPHWHQGTLTVSHGKQVLLRELQVVVVAEPPQDGPGGLVSAALDEESVQEQEPCVGATEVESAEGDGWETFERLWEGRGGTFERQSVALHSVCHVPPHHVLDVLQGLRSQWRVEARSLLTHTAAGTLVWSLSPLGKCWKLSFLNIQMKCSNKNIYMCWNWNPYLKEV